MPLVSPLCCWQPFILPQPQPAESQNRAFLRGGEARPPSSLSVDEARLAVQITSVQSRGGGCYIVDYSSIYCPRLTSVLSFTTCFILFDDVISAPLRRMTGNSRCSQQQTTFLKSISLSMSEIVNILKVFSLHYLSYLIVDYAD